MEKNLFGEIVTAIKTERLSDAALSIDKLIEQNPSNPNNYIKKGDILQKNGMYKEAVGAYHKAAALLVTHGFLKKSLVVYKIILRIDPDNKEASDSIEGILSEIQSTKAVPFPPLPEDSEMFQSEPTPAVEVKEDIEQGLDEDIPYIKDNDFFRPFTGKEIKELLSRAEVKYYSDCEMVITEGDSGDSIYVIKDGNTRVVSHIAGRTIQLATLKRGDVFGEVAFLTGRTRTSSVIAEGPVTVYELNRLLIEDMLELRPEIMDYLNDIYHLRVKETLKRAKDGSIARETDTA